MSFQADGLTDVPQITLNDLGPVTWVNEAFDITDYPGYLQLLNSQRIETGTGPGFEWVIQKDNATNAGDVELGEVDSLADNEVDLTAYMPYRHKHGGWLIEERLVTMNGGKTKIHDYAQQQRAKGWGNFVENVEATIWDLPVAAVTKAFRGIQYYLVTGASTGFTVLDSSGFTTTANIDADTEAKWRNYFDTFTAYSVDDLIQKMKVACIQTKFKTPIKFPNAIAEPTDWAPSHCIYTTRTNTINLSKLAEEQNQNLGGDLNSMAGETTFNRMQIIHVPQLDANTLRPLFGINWNAMKFKVLEGEYMREMKKMDAQRHRTQEFHIDLSVNLKCLSRRRQWRMDYAA